ncbi:laminin subunit alpha-like isoform X5 [Eriocheir sinensis]|uniref:laminin subunit alpha-like isoform X5 n=1 Tax=Eriocheir sinensis TaxID=95602 RepID=UPI0021C92E2A|nr:laminin subunit alpha-like isoform X5 [Eriocheir sinensis]
MAWRGSLAGALWLAALTTLAAGQVLTPPYFNLAENRRITATSTCGEGVAGPEEYCKLVGANADSGYSSTLIQGGQWCDRCDPTHPENAHPPNYAIDGSERWWQSPPLSRGMEYNEVNLTIDLGQLFQVAYVLIKMGNSPRPGVWVLERSVDNGETYTPWQYFADSPGDCESYFGFESLEPISEDDDVICVTHFSKVVPLEGGEIVVSLLNNRPSANSFFNSSVLQEFTRATNVRLRLLRTKTLLGHLMSVERRDPTVTRRYFYSVKDISIGGRCVCNGHADVCDITDPNDQYKLQCRCQHNTCGAQCESCCPGFIQKKWRPASYQDSFVCEPCNCHGHSDECLFSEEVNAQMLSLDIYGNFEGGGVCQNCQDNTEGINCDQCRSGYFRPYGKNLNDTDVCQPCNCNFFYSTGNCAEGSGRCECRPAFLPPDCQECNEGYYDYPECKPCDCFQRGTVGGVCQVGGGQCPCEVNYTGLNCNQCAVSYFGFPDCQKCNCSSVGALNDACNPETGDCDCESKYGGRTCDRCQHGYYNFPSCTFCNCDAQGTEADICDKETGECLCKEGFSGDRCDSNAPGWWGYPLIQNCGCHEKGSASTDCDASGQCACLLGFSGRACSQCSPGYFSFPDCIPCNCEQSGSIGISCNNNGECKCKNNFSGTHCDMCSEGFYNFPICEECNCNPAGVLATFGGCGDAPAGELCQCKERVSGRICDRCKPLYWNLKRDNHLGCEPCDCHIPGTLGGMATCDTETGQCICKPGVTSLRCNQCRDGTFGLREESLFGCTDCGCNVGGSVDDVCDKFTGQCRCRPRVTGQQCDEPLQLHYFPTLYQLQYEAEDGHTPHNTAVRFAYDENVFPGYSWRGYAVFSDIQKEIIQEVYIEKPSTYRMVMFYHNPSDRTIVGKVTLTPDNPSDIEQEFEVYFVPTTQPTLMTVKNVPGNFPIPLVMNPGVWSISIKNTHNLFLDYFVLLPLAYYEGTILTRNVTTPCRMGMRSGDMCLHYAYPDIFQYDYIYGSAGYRSVGEERQAVDLFEDYQVLSQVESRPMAWLNHNQPLLQYDLRLARPGRYVLLFNYYTPERSPTSTVLVETSTMKGREKGRAVVYDCMYSNLCRQVVTDLSGKVGVFHFDSNYVSLNIEGETNTNIALESVVAVPYESWHEDLLRPQRVCTRVDGECIETHYPSPRESVKVEFESNLEGKMVQELPEGIINGTGLVFLNHSDPMVDITGKLKYAGRYLFIVHYYQPLYPDDELVVLLTHSRNEEFEVDVLIQNGQFYEGSLKVPHCPSTSGCRTLIQQLDGSYVFDILENFVLSLKEPNHKSIWLDYVLVVPEQQFMEQIMHELPVERTTEYIKYCGHNNFHIDTNSSEFCKKAAFELTMDYNSGALACQCDFYGSESFECEKFGGQCPCRPNIIGKRCNRCKTGYYGFPECRPCACPSTALCVPDTGECICPPRVEGDRCDRCAPYTYGYDPIIGCEECQCSPLGVRAGNLQCSLQTGQCDCKENVVGRRCDRCAAGYWGFAFCQLCECDLRGSEADICSQEDARCYCKLNVQGRSCESCRPGSYNLEESNPDGCTKCFCFGKSDYCSSADVYWAAVEDDDISRWSVVVVEQAQGFQSGASLTFSSLSVPPVYYQDLIQQDLEGVEDYFPGAQVFFTAPPSYLGNHVKSYGGYLRYSLVFVRANEGTEVSGPTVLLKGGDIIAQHFSPTEPTTPETFTNDIKLTEHNFRTLSGLPLERDQFMMLLYKLEGVFIRANYWSSSFEARLFSVSLDVPVTDGQVSSARQAVSVERCQCPSNYEGSSCEDCARGYYRAQRGPYGGYCVPCQCNGHSDVCDRETGRCLNCRHHTVGDHCEMCASGYHGNATKGTPYDCLICACPLPSITNNFAESCFFLDDGNSVRCDCKEGYVGERCERCAAGYYGQPEVLGDSCQPCQCNNNINPLDQYSCDYITGHCLTCLNNTYGDACERCAPGYYGDAIALKNCERCSCDECGTQNCEHYSGECQCYENVIGEDCDRCAPDHWGFASCQGCQPCQCGLASLRNQCDEGTGQCECQAGVTGQRCDHCRPGFWNYTQYGCQECLCREGFSIGVGCDPRTGQCQCLPGVIGDNCDGCPYRWVLVEGYGCQECGDCVHALLDTTDELSQLIEPTINEFQSAAYSFFLHQRLDVINSTANQLKPQVRLLDISETETLSVDGPLATLMKEAQALSSQTGIVGDRARGAAGEAFQMHIDALKVQEHVEAAFALTRDIVQEINILVIGLETGTGAELGQAISEAEAIVAEMELRNFEGQNDKVEVELEHAKELLEKMQNFFTPVKEQREDMDSYGNRLSTFKEKVNEMKDHIQTAKQKLKEGREIIENNKIHGYPQLKKKLEDIHLLSKQAEKNNKDAKELVDEAGDNHANATSNYEMLVRDVEQLRSAKTTLNKTVVQTMDELEEAELPAQRAIGHSELLQQRAAALDGLLQDTRKVAENALGAANAYKNIVMAIDDAYNASLSANMSAFRAVEMSVGVTDQALESHERSEVKYSLAETRMQQVKQDLRPQLENAEADVRTLRDMNRYTNDTLTFININLNSLDMEAISNDAATLKERGVQSRDDADEAILSINVVEEQLPQAADESRVLLKNMAEGSKAITLAYESVEGAEKQLPEALELAERLRPQKERIQMKGIDMGERLEKLRLTIQKTRELANKIKVGVSFLPNTTIEVENPRDMTKASTSTKVSTFIKTNQPSGLIFFMGTPVGGHQRMRRTTTDDFLALELDRGYVRLTMNLGAGPHTMEYNKLFVADDIWTKIAIERTGKVVKLDVSREDVDTEPVEEVLPGRYSVFNLDPKVSKIFVGGIPAGVEVDRSILSVSYDGQMEDLRLNDQFIGLWNFMSSGTENNYQRGAMGRDSFVDLVPPTGLRFNGEGYAALDTRNGFSFERQFDLQLNFKTYAEDGILFMITGGPGKYIALSMEEGHVIFQFDLGSGGAIMRSENAYNDGQDHRVEVAREKNRGVLRIGSETLSGQSPGTAELFSDVPDTMYFGGYPGEHDFIDVTNDDFSGCIDGVILSSLTVDLSTSKEILGTAPGCPIQVANLVSWDAHAPGYVQFDSPEGSGLQLVFKFKTNQPDGLILYTATSNQNSYLSLSLADSALILRDAPGGELTTGSYDKYNDSEWHVVIATREHNQLRLDIDDFKTYSVRVPQQAVPFDGPVYFGGVPDMKLLAAASATGANFIGCIGDATLNGKIVNFAQSQSQLNAMLQKCPLQKSTSVLVQPSTVMVETTTEEVPMDSCALPLVPEDEDVDSSQGYRFGSKRNSRIEFQALPDNPRADFKFAFGFKTMSDNGIIFYAASGTHQDYITFYIKDGKLVFSFNPGMGAAIMRTEDFFNDGVWHNVVLERKGNEGTLYIDGFLKANGTSRGDSVYIDLQVPYYYGGVAAEVVELVRGNTEGIDLSFNGCLRNIRMNNQRIAGQPEATGVIRCSSNVEPGIFFSGGGRSHVILLKRFSVGRVFEMTMEIKPRSINGVITSVHGRRDFVLLQLRNGSLELSVDNGKGIITATYAPSSPWSFCDGKWHSVQLIKNKNIAILVVDGHTTEPVSGKIGATSTDTKNPLFLGSQPFVTRRRGGAVDEKYVGCMRNISVNKENIALAYATYVGNVNSGTCPTI